LIELNDKLIERINQLKAERNAIIIAHNYINSEVQRVADFVGDSLALSVKANVMNNNVIVFCGPNFMVETAAILNPDKMILYANDKARCPMAGMCDAEGLRLAKKAHPDAVVVGYLNTTAESKTEMDICCTSSNAVEIIKSIKSDKIIFVPDTNLGLYVKRFVPEKEIIFWPGYCHVHERFIRREKITDLMNSHPNAKVLVHPECSPDVIDLSHAVLSTDGMVNYVINSPSNEFIVGTEKEIISRLEKECPGKIYYPVPSKPCQTMKKIKLEDIFNTLETLETKVDLDEEIVIKARRPLEKMMSFGKCV
jgi:quinolinate synthase